jgi:hypothetical protein
MSLAGRGRERGGAPGLESLRAVRELHSERVALVTHLREREGERMREGEWVSTLQQTTPVL